MDRSLIVTAADAPRHLMFEEVLIGDRCAEQVRLTAAAFETFAELSADRAPVHVSDAHAREMGFERRIVPGALTSLRFSRLLGMFLPGALSVIHSTRLEYVAPVQFGDGAHVDVDYSVAVSRTIPALKAVVLDLEARQAGRVVSRGTAQCVVLR